MSKIIKKQDITVLIESTLKSIGIEPNKFVVESKESMKMTTEVLTDLIKKLQDLKDKGETSIPLDLDKMLKDSAKKVAKKHTGKDIDFDKKTNESELNNKPLINEDGLGNIGKGLAITTLTGAIVGSLFVAPNLITIKSTDGEERIADKGESFVGKVTSYGEKGRHKYSTTPLIQVTIVTAKGDTITFYTKENIEFNVGDTIRVTAGNVFSTSASDYEKVSESSTPNKKPLINEDFQNEMDRFKKLSNYTFKK